MKNYKMPLTEVVAIDAQPQILTGSPDVTIQSSEIQPGVKQYAV